MPTEKLSIKKHLIFDISRHLSIFRDIILRLKPLPTAYGTINRYELITFSLCIV